MRPNWYRSNIFHVVYTLPAELRGIASQNKALIYDLAMKSSAETTLTIAADPKHLGARIGIIAVLHTWGSALTHHPHVHMIIPGGGLSQDGSQWVSSRPDFLVYVKLLSRLFRGRFLTMLTKAHARLKFFADYSALADKRAFKRFLAPLRKIEWVVLRQETVCWARAGVALSVPLYPPRRHLQSSSGCNRRQLRRLSLEGLPH